MKRILLLSTGGTIASEAGEKGLEPRLRSDDILNAVSSCYPDDFFSSENLMSLDSSNIQPEHWQQIARKIHESLDHYDGIVVTHGTDTMAYTASALGFMFRNLGKPVVLTGSQVPLGEPLSDAATNLHTAISAVRNDMRGVMVAFDHKIINGARAVKISTMGFDAFASVNAPCMGQEMADGMRICAKQTAPYDPSLPLSLEDGLCTDVFLLKLLPGTKPEIFDALAVLGYRGVVVEAFGAGGIHYVGRNLLEKLQLLSNAGIAVVVCSQCLYERVDLSIYEVGQQMLSKGVIPAGDMTTEAAVTKLMWALHKTGNRDRIADIFAHSYAGEITLDA